MAEIGCRFSSSLGILKPFGAQGNLDAIQNLQNGFSAEAVEDDLKRGVAEFAEAGRGTSKGVRFYLALERESTFYAVSGRLELVIALNPILPVSLFWGDLVPSCDFRSGFRHNYALFPRLDTVRLWS